MEKGIFNEREKAMEANYFRQEDAKLLEQLRKKRGWTILRRRSPTSCRSTIRIFCSVQGLGCHGRTPLQRSSSRRLVQVAWADGSVGKREHEAVLRLARRAGRSEGFAGTCPARGVAEECARPTRCSTLRSRSSNTASLFCRRRRERNGSRRSLDACQEVAAASGTELADCSGWATAFRAPRRRMLDAISKQASRRSR